jgi:hypothetical protein
MKQDLSLLSVEGMEELTEYERHFVNGGEGVSFWIGRIVGEILKVVTNG